MPRYFNLIDPIGRLLASSLFLGSSANHITKWSESLDIVAARGLPVPSLMLGAAVATELAGAFCLILGWNTRLAALALAGFSIVATSLFHANFAVETEFHMFAKDLALGGALLCLAMREPGPFSLDGRKAAS